MAVDLDKHLIAEVYCKLIHTEADHCVGSGGIGIDANYRIGVMLRE